MLRRPALGEEASLGSLYDTRTDTFTAVSVLNKASPRRAITKTKLRQSSTSIFCSDSDDISTKFHQLGVGADLGASYLAGSASAHGTSHHFLSERDSNLCAQASLLYNINTVKETIRFEPKNVNLDSVQSTEATHVVSEVSWGSNSIITIEEEVLSQEAAKHVSENLRKEITLLANQLSIPKHGHGPSSTQEFGNSYRVWFFSDVDRVELQKPTTMSDALERLVRVPDDTAKLNRGRGKQLFYTLLPIGDMCNMLNGQVPRGLAMRHISPESFQQLFPLFEQAERNRRDLSDYVRLLEGHETLVLPPYLKSVHEKLEAANSNAARHRAEFARLLKGVRCNRADESTLLEAANNFCREYAVTRTLNSQEDAWYNDKIKFVQALLDKGAEYAGSGGPQLDNTLRQVRDVNFYVLLLSDKARDKISALKEQIVFAHTLLESHTPASRFIIKDCDALGEPFSEARIILFRNGKEIIKDVLKDSLLFKKVSRARYTGPKMDSDRAPRPLSTALVTIPCPNTLCGDEGRDWICEKCGCNIEYERSNQFICCDCGRYSYRHWSFRCCGRQHGYTFTRYQDGRLLQLLNTLKLSKTTNILILGQTGVGKSTWINGFVNYLQYLTLDDALQEDHAFKWIIPFAFQVNDVNDKGEYEAVKVKVGFNESEEADSKSAVAEKDGISGASSTQATAVHRVKVDETIIRLIDTPGIGDTEGSESDKKNMADILSVLRSYKDIHGILILLKPNDQKLSLMFKFCVQELLANLHRDAARNIVFGFTNTRGTNYKPGDTFGPLTELLNQHKDTVDIKLDKDHVYCFDSESFRFLAAQKTCNHTIGNLDENRTSWQMSVKESRRLIDYFQRLPPHNVRNTVNLYETRYRIVSLTKPMADIAAAIEATIRINEDDIRDLQQSNTRKEDLEKRLRTRVKTLTAVPVERPLTTCADKACVAYWDSGTKGKDGKSILSTKYKSMCHSPCYLEGVALENIGDAALKSCWAMAHGDVCRECSHPWNTHLHINYKIQEGYKEINDPDVEASLRQNADICAQKEASIASKTQRIGELEMELKKIRDTAAQFSVFLRANAILPYNDATLEYLQHQIDEEMAKVAAGGSRDKLDNLTSYQQQYKQQVVILEECRHQKQHQMLLDQSGVDVAVAQLQSLKIYGAMLQDLEEAIRSSEGSASREKGLLMRAKTNWGGRNQKPVQTHLQSPNSSPEERDSLSTLATLLPALDSVPILERAQGASETPQNTAVITVDLEKQPEKPFAWFRSTGKRLWANLGI